MTPLANATTADFRNGMVIRYNNELYTITEFHHVSPGNWRAFVRTRLKNLKNGRIIEQRFRAGEDIEEVRVEHQDWQQLAAKIRGRFQSEADVLSQAGHRRSRQRFRRQLPSRAWRQRLCRIRSPDAAFPVCATARAHRTSCS